MQDPDPFRPARRRGALAALLTFGVALANPAIAKSDDPLRFRVYLDRDPIGEHSFLVGKDGAEVVSRANFDVKVLFFNAYRYRHESRETWRNGCLTQILATTDDNGRTYRIESEQRARDLQLRVNGEPRRLPSCVSTFAYWNRDFLKQRQLLNPQTGELVAVQVETTGTEPRRVEGRTVQAERYRLRADQLEISLWYTPEGRWIGLESDTGKGVTLRYEPI